MTDADDAWVAEQDRLAKALEGQGSSLDPGREAALHLREEVEKALNKEPVVDPKVYAGVEQLLFRGFLTQRCDMGGTVFVFKSLNHHEFEHLGWWEEGDPKRYHSLFLAYCVFMVDGVSYLGDREDHLDSLVKFFEELAEGARRKMVRHLSELGRRASNAVTLTEAYAMETYSRWRWQQLKGLDMTGTSVTGIRGTDRLGLNWGQLAWRALNGYEDSREEGERDWDNAKFVGGCMAGKGIQKVYNQDKERRKAEKSEHFARKDFLLRHILLGESEKSASSGLAIKAAVTVEDLVNQLESDLKGEKDWHDQVVAYEQDRMARQWQERRQQIQTMSAGQEEKFGPLTVMGGTDMTGLSPKEVQDRIAARGPKRELPPDLVDDKLEKFKDKWDNTYGTSEEVGDPARVVRPIAVRPPGTPFRK